ncbi:MAG: TolC family protein [Steroidobacteraceae bacterium]
MRQRSRLPLAATLLAASASLALQAHAETLEEAWRLAAARNQTLAAAAAEVQAARAGERAARDRRWPSIEADASYTHLAQAPELDVVTPTLAFRSGPIFKDNQYVSGTVQMRVPLYTGGAIRAGIAAARAGLSGASAELTATAADVKLAVAQAYVTVLRTRRQLRVARASVTSLAAHLRDVEAMFHRQMVAKSDLLAAEVALANARSSKVSAEDAVEIAQEEYNRLLGEPLSRVPHLDPVLPTFSVDAQPLKELVQRALASRPELRAIAARAGALADRARAAGASRLPHIAAMGGYTHFDNQILNRENFSSVGVGFTWKLFDGGAAANEADALRARSRADRRRLADLRSRIELEVQADWLALGAARERVRASRAATVQAAENLRISRELYGVGLASNTQVLSAVTLRTQAEENYNNAVLDAALDQLRLAYAVGAL